MSDLPEKLGALEIGDAVEGDRQRRGRLRPAVPTKGMVDLEFDVPATGGSAQSVRARGQLAGTDVAQCLLRAAHKAQFPSFQQGKQTFKFSLRMDGR